MVTNALSDSVTNLINYGGFVSVGISLFLIYVASYMGIKFEEYTKTGTWLGVRRQVSQIGVGVRLRVSRGTGMCQSATVLSLGGRVAGCS